MKIMTNKLAKFSLAFLVVFLILPINVFAEKLISEESKLSTVTIKGTGTYYTPPIIWTADLGF